MTEPIGRLVICVTLLLKPRGAHRRTRPRPSAYPAPPPPSPIGIAPLPAHRSPYGLPTVLDGAETVAVRPYLFTHALYGRQAAA